MADASGAGADAKARRLIEAHRDIYASVLTLMGEIEPDVWDLETGCPGWTAHDQLSHMIGLERTMLGEPYPDHEVDPLPAHVKGVGARVTEIDVDLRRGRPHADMLAEASEVFHRRKQALATLTGDQLSDEIPSPMGLQPAGRILPMRIFDLWMHEQDIRRTVGRPGHLEGAAPEICLTRGIRGVSAVVAERIDRDARVVVEVTGPSSGTFTVDLGPSEHEPTRPAEVTLRIPFDVFMALGGGRSDADRSQVEISGDDVLASDILDAFAYTP